MNTDLMGVFQSFRTILCICPRCGNLMRLSDLRLKYKGEAPRTWLDTHDLNSRRLQTQEEEFAGQERKLRTAAHERAHRKVPELICKCMDRDLARFKYNPYDIKLLSHPVDFVVFNGLSDGQKIEDITFLSKRTENSSLDQIRDSLAAVVDSAQYDWRVARVSIEGNVEID